MGKSHHKSRKRRRSSSPDRLAALEERVSQLFDLIHKKVRAPTCADPTASMASSSAHQEHRRSHSDSESVRSVSADEVPLARQVGPMDLQISGVYDITGPVFVKYRRYDNTTLFDGIPTVLPEECEAPNEEAIVADLSPDPPRGVSFEEPSAPVPLVTEDSLSKQLFGSDLEDDHSSPWDELVTQKWRDLSRKGLAVDQRNLLLQKYAPPEAVAFLKSPTLNQECSVALKGNSILKRDDYARKNQDQVGTALCALGEAISSFLKPEVQATLGPEARSAVSIVNDGAKILADLFFRLSLSRRALITPALNLLAKNTVDAIPVDEFLFGSSFGESLKKATSMEKASKDIIKTPLTISRKIQQPMKQLPRAVHVKAGNARAPAKHSHSATRRAGASSNYRRSSFRSRSRSRRT